MKNTTNNTIYTVQELHIFYKHSMELHLMKLHLMGLHPKFHHKAFHFHQYFYYIPQVIYHYFISTFKLF